MNPTWYDILGVERDASAEQIKAAWRDSTDKFEPGAGGSRFRMFNEAAEVLLDPEKRRAYDAELAGTEEPVADVAPVAAEDASPPAPEPQAPARRRLPAILGVLSSTVGLAILAVLATAAVALAVYLVVDQRSDSGGSSSSAGGFDPAEGIAAASVAERAVAAVLAYDYRNMDADRDRALAFLTPEYQETYEKIFEGLINGTEEAPGGAITTKAVVAAEVLSTAVVDVDGDTVKVLVFVDQQPTTDGKQQQVLANRVVATMVQRDGTWLLDTLDPLSAGF